MQDNDEKEGLTYVVSDGPDVKMLADAFDEAVGDSSWFVNQCRSNYDYRRNLWAGKSDDLRKHGATAFPWEGAADGEAHVINERINAYVAICMNALDRANIRANPVEVGDVGRAKVVSSFLRWMRDSYIPDYRRQMELAANYLFEKGLTFTYVGWKREDRTYKQRFTIEQLAGVSPELAQALMGGQQDAQMVEMMLGFFPRMTEKKAKQAIKDIRKTGEAEFTVVRRQVDCPCVMTLSPDSDVIYPSSTSDPQKAPYNFWVQRMTEQEIRNKVSTEGWDEEWVHELLEKGSDSHQEETLTNREAQSSRTSTTNRNLYEIIYAFQRLIDPEDNSEGIYCTIFNKNLTGERDEPAYAKHELLNGYESYPMAVTKLSEDSKRMYDVQAFPEILRGIQWQVKVERDSRVDRNGLATLPGILHPAGTPPPKMAPGQPIAYRRVGELSFGPIPPYNPGSVEMESTMLEQADNLIGLNPENPLSTQKQQFYVTKFLTHAKEVLKQAYRAYQRHGPDELFFRVTGSPDPVKFNRGNPDENFDFQVQFDILSNDPENAERQMNQMASLLQFDKSGRIGIDQFLEFAANAINPVLADSILQPAEVAHEKVVKNVTDDLSKVYSGIEVGARPNGAQLALQIIQQYATQPDIMQRMQTDEAFQKRLTKLAQQYQFQMQQAQNAQIGKIGTAPAAVGGVDTQWAGA